MGRSPLKIAPSIGDLDHPRQIYVPWAYPSQHPKRNLDRFRLFAGLTIVTVRPTDHATRSVTIDRIYVRKKLEYATSLVCSTAMRPNNYYTVSQKTSHV